MKKLSEFVLIFLENPFIKRSVKFTDETLEKLGKLSALKIPESEKEQLKLFLTKVLSYFEAIQSIDTKNTPALLSPLSPPPREREDQAIDFPEKEKLLDQATGKQGALIKTPSSL